MGSVSGGKWAANDGIVNTASMDGPPGNVRDAEEFVSHLDLANLEQVQGPFWYFGENGTIDHADQLGVYTDPTTVSRFLYECDDERMGLLIWGRTKRWSSCISCLPSW